MSYPSKYLVIAFMGLILLGLAMGCSPVYHDAMPCSGYVGFEPNIYYKKSRKPPPLFQLEVQWLPELSESPGSMIVIIPYFGAKQVQGKLPFSSEYLIQSWDTEPKDGISIFRPHIDLAETDLNGEPVTAISLLFTTFRGQQVMTDTLDLTVWRERDPGYLNLYVRETNTCYEEPKKIRFSKYRKHYYID